jgi:hypothetical protein
MGEFGWWCDLKGGVSWRVIKPARTSQGAIPREWRSLILPFRQLGKIDDPLTELAREGARRMLAEMLKAEADAFVAKFSDERLGDGRQRVVRHGFGPERQIQTGIGPLDVQRPKVRDPLPGSRMPAFYERGAAANTLDTSIRFTSNILPKWARRSVSLDALLPVLYLKGEEDQKTIRGTVFPTQGPATFRRRCRRFWEPTHPTCLQACWPVSQPAGRQIMTHGL